MITVFSIYQYVKNKLANTKEGTAAYDALFDVYTFIRTNMNSSYGMMSDKTSSMPEYDEELEMKKFAECLNKLTKENGNNENIH